MKCRRLKLYGRRIVLLILFLWSWITFGFNTFNPDYRSYEFTYETLSTGSTVEIGFKIICGVFKFIGMPYSVFLIMISFAALGILIKCICDYSDSPVFVYVAYLFYPFFMDVIQIRMFLAEVVVMYAIRYLEEFNKKNVIKYVLFIILAASFHSTAIVYFLLMIVYVKEIKNVAVCSMILTGILLFFRVFAFRWIERFIRSLSILGRDVSTGSGYLNYTNTYFRLMWLYFLIGGSIIVLCTYRYYLNNSKAAINSFVTPAKGLKLVWVSLIFIPLFSFGSSFGRMYHRLLPILYCVIINGTVLENGILKTKNFLIKFYGILIAFVLFYAHIYDGELNAYQRILRNILDNNAFWQ